MGNDAKDLKDIFSKVEKTLFEYVTDDYKKVLFNKRKPIDRSNFSDNDYYEIMISVVFFSGFRAETVENKLETIKQYFSDYKKAMLYDEKKISEMTHDPNMIKNEKKILACIKNANTFAEIIKEHVSFKNYINQFEPYDNNDNIEKLKNNLIGKFSYIGEITVNHFLTDLGFNVLKPDLVVMRVFSRLGLIESNEASPENIKMAVEVGQEFSETTDCPIRYIDFVFVSYGADAGERFVDKKSICSGRGERCDICGVHDICRYNLSRKE